MDANTTTMVDTLVPVILPAIVDLIKSLHAQSNPTAPPLSDAEALAALQAAAAATEAKDAQWLAAHPTAADATSPAPSSANTPTTNS